MKDDRLYLIHMRECVERILSYTADGRRAFKASSLVQDAVLRNLQTLAESSKRVSEQVKERNPEVAWKKMAGFRNVLVHDYLGVDLGEVWDIVHEHLPTLQAWLEKIFEELDIPRSAAEHARRRQKLQPKKKKRTN